MERPLRVALGGCAYHMLNRANGRLAIFRKDGDYAAVPATFSLARVGPLSLEGRLSRAVQANGKALESRPTRGGVGLARNLPFLPVTLLRIRGEQRSAGRPRGARPGLALEQPVATAAGSDGPGRHSERLAGGHAAKLGRPGQPAASGSRVGGSADERANGRPCGDAGWTERTARKMGLESTCRACLARAKKEARLGKGS
jgi:hypothetical protein